MFASEAIPAFLFGAFMFLVPETPRYLAMRSRDDKALSVLEKINGREKALQTLSDIKDSVKNAVSGKVLAYGWAVVIVGILLSVFQQFVGINTVLYYAPEIFKDMGGVGTDTSMLQTVVMGLVNVIFTVLAILTVDKWGRKPLLVTGSIGMAVGMIALAVMSSLGIIGIWTLVFIIIFTASFMMSWGPICWVLIAEIFPNMIRGKAVAIAVAAQWMANFLISSTYPPMMEASPTMTYGFYGLMSILSALFVWKMVPETKGKTLEQMEAVWKKS
jgi:SP family xylose:H+ symportor-like MFS transporter